MKTNHRHANKQSGFSLLELVIVVAIIGILSAISVIGYNAVSRGTKESLVAGRLREVAEAQMQFRVGMARRRYATLQELRTTMTPAGMPLLSPQLVPADSSGNSVAFQGWIIREPSGAPSGDALRSAYSIVAVPESGSTSQNSYCIHQDGTLRVQGGGGTCTINSTPVDQTSTARATPTPGRGLLRCPNGSLPPCVTPTPVILRDEGEDILAP